MVCFASVCLSVCPVSILTVTHQGAACGVASVNFGPTITRTVILVDGSFPCESVSASSPVPPQSFFCTSSRREPSLGISDTGFAIPVSVEVMCWSSGDGHWLKYTFWCPGAVLKYGAPAFSGAPLLHDGPGRSYVPSTRTPSRSLYAKIVQGHILWHMYSANNKKTAI